MDEVLRLPVDQELIILRGQKVLKAEKFDYTLHPHAQLVTPVHAIDHIPQWRSQAQSPVLPRREPPTRSAPKNGRKQSVPQKSEDEPLQIVDARQLFL